MLALQECRRFCSFIVLSSDFKHIFCCLPDWQMPLQS